MVNTKIRLINILCSQRWRSSLQSAKPRPGANCGSDHELLIYKFRFKLKIVRKTTRPFRYKLNQIPYDYTVEVGNRFKGLDLIECQMNNGRGFLTLYRRQGARPSPRKRNAKKQNGYIFPFLLCFSRLFFSQLFVRPPQTAILLFCISFPWGWS